MKLMSFTSIRQKLVFIITLTTGISLTIVSTIFISYELITYQQTLANKLSMQAKMISKDIKPALLSDKKVQIQLIINSFQNDPHITFVELYSPLGKSIAHYQRDKDTGLGFLSRGVYKKDNLISIYHAIEYDNAVIGVIGIQTDLGELKDRLWIFIRILIIVMLSTFLVTLYISSRLQSLISEPISSLVKTMNRISVKKDASIRAMKQSEDELGYLTDAFNRMLHRLKITEKKLVYQATHDHLTTLPNRSMIYDRIERLIQRARRKPNYHFAVFFVDLDRFKLINDSYGHLKGDQVLIEYSKKLVEKLRKVDTVGRLGGDEFVLIADEFKNLRNLHLISERIQDLLKEPIVIEDQEVTMSASVGIVINNLKYERPEEYIRDADNAMFHAKSRGRGLYQIFDENMHKETKSILSLEMALGHAIKNDEMILHYQPILALKNEEIIGLEALARWQHPEKGLIGPNDFINNAEESGLIVPLGNLILTKVCHQAKFLQSKGHKCIKIAFNVSVKQLEQNHFFEDIKQIVKSTGVDPKWIELEITESVLMKNVNANVELLKNLNALGFDISLDDFGTGHSSLDCLRFFPVKNIKIDRSFIHKITEIKENAAITKAIIDMSHSLNCEVIAEGVETKKDLNYLKKLGCDKAQGHLFSLALPEERMNYLLDTKLRGKSTKKTSTKNSHSS